MAIHGALLSSSIHRLQRTWRLLGKREQLLLEEIKEIMSYRRNFGDYRKVIKVAKPPCIPFLGLYLTDLTFIEDGNKDTLSKTEFVNYDKRLKYAQVLQEIQHFQRVPYLFQAVPQILVHNPLFLQILTTAPHPFLELVEFSDPHWTLRERRGRILRDFATLGKEDR